MMQIEIIEDGLTLVFKDGDKVVQAVLPSRMLAPYLISGQNDLTAVAKMMQSAVLRAKDEPNWAAEEPEVKALVDRLKDATATPEDKNRLDSIWERRLKAVGA